MTPERREELRRAEDALISARYNLDRKNYLATIAAQEDRINVLEYLLARSGYELKCIRPHASTYVTDKLIAEIDAILPATPTDN